MADLPGPVTLRILQNSVENLEACVLQFLQGEGPQLLDDKEKNPSLCHQFSLTLHKVNDNSKGTGHIFYASITAFLR